MLVAGIWVVLLGTCLIIVAAVVLAIRWYSLLLIRRLRTTPRLTCAELTSASQLPRRVLVSGTTAPGAAGILTSPANRIPCLWYRFAVNETVEGSVSRDPFSSGATTIVRRTEGSPIAVDDNTGSVLLDVDIAVGHVSGKGIIVQLLDEAALSGRHHADAGSPMANLEKAGLLPGRVYGQVLRKPLLLQEDIITADSPVTVLGGPRRKGGRIMLGRGVLSAADPESWIAILDADNRSSAALLRFFPIGSVVCAVGVVLILIGVH